MLLKVQCQKVSLLVAHELSKQKSSASGMNQQWPTALYLQEDVGGILD